MTNQVAVAPANSAELQPAPQEMMLRELAREYAVQSMAILPPDFDDMKKLATIFVDSGYFKLGGSNAGQAIAQAVVKIMIGRDFGLSATASMRGIYMFDNNIGFSAQTMANLLRKHGYNYRITEASPERCEIEFYFGGESCGPAVEWTIDMAKTAGLFGKDNWQKYPQDMLFARCMATGCRRYAPEIFAGAQAYASEELADMQTPAFLERGSDEQMAVATEEKTQALRKRMEKAKPVKVEPTPTEGPIVPQAPQPEPEAPQAETPEAADVPWSETAPAPDPAPADEPTPDRSPRKRIASEEEIKTLVAQSFAMLAERKGSAQPVPPFVNIQRVFEVAGFAVPEKSTDGQAQLFMAHWRLEFQRAVKAEASANSERQHGMFGKGNG